jgi:hypothetical protein
VPEIVCKLVTCALSALCHVMVGRATHSLFLDGGAVTAEDKLLGGCCEVWQAGNGQVLVVEVGVLAEDLVGLASIVSR